MPFRRLLACLLALLAFRPAAGQQAPPPLVVMNLAAHPDDEDGATLAYYRYARDAVAYSVIFTRGEGGQNEIGPELYQALGALRTEETERAARHLGTQVFFLNFYDFGFSKTADEAFAVWGGRDRVTARLVYLLRKLKPDVLFTNHDTVTVGPGRQHGQHQAVGIAAYDAFVLAADPAYHPEQLGEEGVGLWQPKRLFLRRWRGDEPHDVEVPIGRVDPAAQRSYAALAADALGDHASQGMDLFARRLREMKGSPYRLLRSAVDAPPPADDLAGNLPPDTHRTAAPDLAYAIDSGRVRPLPEGLLTLSDSVAVAGQYVRLRWDPARLPERRLRWVFTGPVDTTLYLSDTSPGQATLRLDPRATPTVPRAVYGYERFTSRPPVVYAVYPAGGGDLLAAGYLPLEVAPPLHVEAAEEVVRLRSGPNGLAVRGRLYDPAAGRVVLGLAVSRDADRRVVLHEETTLSFDAEGRLADTLRFTLPDSLAPGTYTLTLTALPRPATLATRPVHARAAGRVFDVAVPAGLRVGLVQSYDNTLQQALRELGVPFVLLDSLALARGTFDGLHTIVLDIRSYLVRQDLRRHNDRLLDWVRRGGHLVVNYQKTIEWNASYPDPFDERRSNPGTFAPYPLTLGGARVTREEAPVEVLVPDHPLLHEPNPIGPEAWTGWVQERGLYFPETYDDRYQELLCMQDPGEAPLCGSTLLASYGEGTYLYTALVWYRQLKAYHPGAYALFANLVSLPLVDGRARTSMHP